ncbi:MAG: hypothetical protein MUF84_17290 [Anaerolineae bacterium]|nr:hypothetical protein [Anaerolineae bacterium]
MTVFSVDASHDDVELMLRDVGDAVRRWESGESLGLSLSEQRLPDGALLQRARLLRMQARIDRGAIIHSTRPRVGPLVIRFQRLVRRLTWWFTEPLLQQVSAYQVNSALVVESLAEGVDALGRDPGTTAENDLRARLAELELRVQQLESQLGASAAGRET